MDDLLRSIVRQELQPLLEEIQALRIALLASKEPQQHQPQQPQQHQQPVSYSQALLAAPPAPAPASSSSSSASALVTPHAPPAPASASASDYQDRVEDVRAFIAAAKADGRRVACVVAPEGTATTGQAGHAVVDRAAHFFGFGTDRAAVAYEGDDVLTIHKTVGEGALRCVVHYVPYRFRRPVDRPVHAFDGAPIVAFDQNMTGPKRYLVYLAATGLEVADPDHYVAIEPRGNGDDTALLAGLCEHLGRHGFVVTGPGYEYRGKRAWDVKYVGGEPAERMQEKRNRVNETMPQGIRAAARDGRVEVQEWEW